MLERDERQGGSVDVKGEGRYMVECEVVVVGCLVYSDYEDDALDALVAPAAAVVADDHSDTDSPMQKWMYASDVEGNDDYSASQRKTQQIMVA